MLRTLALLPLFACICTSPAPTPAPLLLTIDNLVWSEDLFGDSNPGLLAHIQDWPSPPTLHGFTREADKHFYLESDQHRIPLRCGTGGITSEKHGRFLILRTARGSVLERGPSTEHRLQLGRTYTLRPRNDAECYTWAVAEGVSISL